MNVTGAAVLRRDLPDRLRLPDLDLQHLQASKPGSAGPRACWPPIASGGPQWRKSDSAGRQEKAPTQT